MVEGLDRVFEAEIWHWRGPSPFYFVTMPEDATAPIRAIAGVVSYGWGMIPVTVRIGGTTWTTAMFPKDGRYVVPIKDAVRRAEDVDEGETVRVEVSIAP
jgi:hypothetical protein